jgi:two-component sensor histidine kinase
MEKRPAADLLGKSHWELWPGTYDTELGALYRKVMEERAPVALEHQYQWASGRIAWLDMRAYPTDDGIAIFYRDITDRMQAKEHQALLNAELSHRAKNLLAIVQSIAQQTFKSSKASPTEMVRDFEGRLGALSAAHSLLTQRSWEPAPMQQLIRDALKAVVPDMARVEIDGPDILLPPQSVVSFAMASHELATNALKYGALSNASGRVRVEWRVAGAKLTFHWSEHDGPPVITPSKRGFGTRMIERGLPRDLHGRATISFEPDGLVCQLEAPLPGAAK